MRRLPAEQTPPPVTSRPCAACCTCRLSSERIETSETARRMAVPAGRPHDPSGQTFLPRDVEPGAISHIKSFSCRSLLHRWNTWGRAAIAASQTSRRAFTGIATSGSGRLGVAPDGRVSLSIKGQHPQDQSREFLPNAKTAPSPDTSSRWDLCRHRAWTQRLLRDTGRVLAIR